MNNLNRAEFFVTCQQMLKYADTTALERAKSGNILFDMPEFDGVMGFLENDIFDETEPFREGWIKVDLDETPMYPRLPMDIELEYPAEEVA